MISLGRPRAIGLACLPLLIFALCYARFSASDRVAPSVTLAGVKLAGASRAEAEQRLLQRSRALAREKLRLSLAGAETSLTLDELGVALDARGSAARALRVARSGNALADALHYARALVVREDVPPTLHVDRAKLSAALTSIEPKLIADAPFRGGFAVEGTTARALSPRPGREISIDLASIAIADAVARGRLGQPVALSARTVTPELEPGSLERAAGLATHLLAAPVVLEAGERRVELGPAELGTMLTGSVRDGQLELALDPQRFEAWLAEKRAELEAPPRDARFEVSASDEVRVVPGEPGVRLDGDAVAHALWSAAQSDARRGELPLLREPEPARSTERAEQLAIHHLVGSFTTRHPCCQPRVENIHRIASLLDGLVVEPGQTVSVNEIVGPRTQKNGFVPAPSIEDGEMVDTVGGGVSQFATTLFNVLFRAGYDIIERKPHTYWFPRYPMGIEATLSWPHPDIVFKNDSQAGLLVKTSFTDRSVSVKLYGDAGGRRVSYDVSERREIVPPTVELLPNRAVPIDEEQVKEGGMIGWSVMVSRSVRFADGTKKEEKRKVTYKPKARRVEVHPCRIPKGEPGATGEPCPEPPPSEPEPASGAAEAQPG